MSHLTRVVLSVVGVGVIWGLSKFVGNSWNFFDLLANWIGETGTLVVSVVVMWLVILSFLWPGIRGLFVASEEDKREALEEAQRKIDRSPHR